METPNEEKIMKIFEKIENVPDEEICQICWCKKNEENTVLACKRCKKEYHSDCIEKMIAHNRQSCPNCRNRIDDSLEEFDFTNIVLFTPEFIEMQHIVYRAFYIARISKFVGITFLTALVFCGFFYIPYINQ